jgi:hypothetical protein
MPGGISRRPHLSHAGLRRRRFEGRGLRSSCTSASLGRPSAPYKRRRLCFSSPLHWPATATWRRRNDRARTFPTYPGGAVRCGDGCVVSRAVRGDGLNPDRAAADTPDCGPSSFLTSQPESALLPVLRPPHATTAPAAPMPQLPALLHLAQSTGTLRRAHRRRIIPSELARNAASAGRLLASNRRLLRIAERHCGQRHWIRDLGVRVQWGPQPAARPGVIREARPRCQSGPVSPWLGRSPSRL